MIGSKGSANAEECHLTGPSALRTVEFVLLPTADCAEVNVLLPSTPGAVRYSTSGAALLLHIAPGHWLAPSAAVDLEGLLRGFDALKIGVVFDTSGKWQALSLLGAGSQRILAAGADVDAVLGHRGCAMLHLFDCPVILAKRLSGFDMWVHASYAHDLTSKLQDLVGHSSRLS